MDTTELDGSMMSENLRKARTNQGLTQSDIAERLDISVTAYQKIESGKTRIINKNYEKCAKELGLSLSELVNGFKPVRDADSKIEDVKKEYKSKIDSLKAALHNDIEKLTNKIADLENTIGDKDKIIHTQELLIEHLQKDF